MSKEPEELRERVERTLAIFFTGNRMPHMSGDPRERVPPAKRRDLSDATDSIMELVSALTAERDVLAQTSAILCEDCGWSTKFPDVGCVNCGFHKLSREAKA
jgi:hypothetical protein